MSDFKHIPIEMSRDFISLYKDRIKKVEKSGGDATELRDDLKKEKERLDYLLSLKK